MLYKITGKNKGEVLMNAYLASVIENVRKKHADEPEFVQTVEEVFTSLGPVIDKHPEYEKADLLNRMMEQGVF